MVNEVSDKFHEMELKNRVYKRIAWNIYHMWEETGHSDTRLFVEPLIPDKFTIVGKSKKGTDRKEHVVPRVLLCKQCHKMFAELATVEEVALLISNFLKVVLISKEEQEHLDNTLGLKQKMPQGWSFESGDVYARLHHAKIKYELFA